MAGQGMVQIPIEDIAIGVPCRCDVNDDLGVLLLAAGNSLTTSLRAQLIHRGISFLEVSAEDADALLGKRKPKRQASRKSKGASQSASLRQTPIHQRKDRSQETYSAVRAKVFREQLSDSVGQLAELGHSIDFLSNHDLKQACDVPQALLSMLLDDGDQAISSCSSVSSNSSSSAVEFGEKQDSIASRCTQMSMLSINTGIEMGLDRGRVELLGQSGLLHDFGLYKIAPHLRDPASTLTPAERDEYRRHPNITQDLLKRFTVATDEISVIVSQVHERPSGKGYPRGLRSNLTHPLASVLSVVDGFLSLMEPGPDRLPIQPHDAISVMLHEGARGVYDSKALRAFLTQITLFPIGSRVLLDDDREATVMRRDAAHYATPIIQADGSDEFLFTRLGACKIRKPMVSRKRQETRLQHGLIPTITMDSLVAA